MRIRPNIVIHLEVKAQAAQDRLTKEKFDPETGNYYNLGT
jgi:hypothetical protein